MNARYSTAVAAILVAMSAVAPAAAQESDGPRPTDNLFGPRTVDASVKQTFDATLFLSGAYDANQGGEGTPRYGQTGVYELLSGTASYLSRGERVQWGAGVGSTLRYQNSDSELLRVSDYGALGIAARIGRRWNVSASQAATCSLVNFQGLVGVGGVSVPGVAQIGGTLPSGDFASTSGDQALDRLQACSFDTGGGVGLTLSQRSTVELRGGGSLSVFEPQSGYRSLPSYYVGGRLSHSVSQRARLNIGYTRRTSQFGVTGAAAANGTVHDIDLGVDYRRPLSLTRRTSIDFSVGPTAISEGQGVSRLRYGLTGGASLNHQFLRTWGARLGYTRGVSMVTGLTGPAFSDGVSLSLSGLLSRRVQFFASGDTRMGDVGGAGQEESPFTAHYATTRLQVALARNWALSGDYTYFAHDFAPGAVALAVPFSQERHAARVGLTWWIPILSR